MTEKRIALFSSSRASCDLAQNVLQLVQILNVLHPRKGFLQDRPLLDEPSGSCLAFLDKIPRLGLLHAVFGLSKLLLFV